MMKGAMIGLTITSLTNLVYRRELTRGVKIGGIFVGLMGGSIWGIL
jgi:hypothetical protein